MAELQSALDIVVSEHNYFRR